MLKSGSSKTVSLTARVRRDIADGYYSVPLEIVTNATAKNDGSGLAREKINIWITKSTSTLNPDESEGDIRFELGRDRIHPPAFTPKS